MTAIIIRKAGWGREGAKGIEGLSTTGIKQGRVGFIKPAKLRGVTYAIRWGELGPIPPNLVEINTAEAIREASNKKALRLKLQEVDSTLVPKTLIAGETLREEHLPVVVRPNYHSKGRDFVVLETLDTPIRHNEHTHYVSKFINKASEYRVFIVQGRVVCVYNKIPADRSEPVWNVDNGGSFEHVRWDEWPLQAVRKSVEAFNQSALDFGAVDVIISQEGAAYVLEINTAPGLKFNSDGTPSHRMLCMAKAFDWMVTYGKERIGIVDQRGGYRKFIHPAICDNAILISL